MSEEITVLLGLFDGLHLGHMSAVQKLLDSRGRKLVYTFDSATMSTKGDRGLLMTDAKKREKLLKLGADEVISRDFEMIRDITPREFVENILRNELHAKRVICGENFRFGRGGQADAKDLRSICSDHGIETVIVPIVYADGKPISTTRIRGLIESGNISGANKLLGYPYGFEGMISHGDRVGTKMGIKTLNILFDTRRVLPKKGVYVSRTEVLGKSYKGVTNIGTRPTVHDDGRIVIETHILDFEGNVYGETACVELIEYLREEKRFGSLEELKRTVANDINTVRRNYNE